MKQTFTFSSVPSTLAELQALPEASLDSAYKTAALSVLALMNFDRDPDTMFQMLDFLNGPDSVSPFTRQFIRDRLSGKSYKVSSFFEGATPANGYQPSLPLKITVSDNPYSFKDQNFAVVYVKSSGADSERPIRLRKKPSTGQWFMLEIQCLSDIRVPADQDPWA